MAEQLYTTDNTEFERLLSLGFSETEAGRLVYLKAHVSEQVEYKEMLAESRRLSFVRWLIEHDRISR